MNSIGATAMRAAAFITGEDFWRGIVAIIGFLLFWEVGSRSEAWFGFAFPWISANSAAYGRVRRKC